MLKKHQKRQTRHKRIRAKIKGTIEKPRLCVFKSLNHIYAQIINDEEGKTIISANDKTLLKKSLKSSKEKKYSGKTEIAYEVGKLIAKSAKEKKISKVVFDRGGYKYHGRIKALAEGAREEGLSF